MLSQINNKYYGLPCDVPTPGTRHHHEYWWFMFNGWSKSNFICDCYCQEKRFTLNHLLRTRATSAHVCHIWLSGVILIVAFVVSAGFGWISSEVRQPGCKILKFCASMSNCDPRVIVPTLQIRQLASALYSCPTWNKHLSLPASLFRKAVTISLLCRHWATPSA